MVKFDLTALHRILEDGEICQVAECFVPCDLGYKECEEIRSLITKVDTRMFPREVQQVIVWGQRLVTDTEVCVLDPLLTLLIIPDTTISSGLIFIFLYSISGHTFY